jgi:Flp pilus assembly pilin Flp
VTISTEAQRQPKDHAETGQALVEYALILTLMTLFCLVSLQLVSTNLRSLLDSIASAVAGAV